jgi:hypothetical protein
MWESLSSGYLTVTAGTPVHVSSVDILCQAIRIQGVVGNTDPVYLLKSASGSLTTGVGVLVGVGAPTLNSGSKATSLQCESSFFASQKALYNLKDFWIDGGHSGDKVLISYLII